MEDDKSFLGFLSSLVSDGAQPGDAAGLQSSPVILASQLLPRRRVLLSSTHATIALVLSVPRREVVALMGLMALWRGTCACQVSGKAA